MINCQQSKQGIRVLQKTNDRHTNQQANKETKAERDIAYTVNICLLFSFPRIY